MSNKKEVLNLLEDLEELLKRATEIKEQIQNLVKPDSSKPRTKLYLHVTMPNGKQICHTQSVDTYVETIELLETEKVYHTVVTLGIRWRTYPVVDVGHANEPAWRPSGDYGIYTGNNTQQKEDNLKRIANYLKLPIEVKVLDESEYREYSRSDQLNLT